VTERDKILIVDDNDAGRYVKRHILEQAGYTVSDASEGLEALRAIVGTKPDLVLLDVNLPDITGVELCRKLRENQVSIAVLMTSAAFVDAGDRVAALESGADSYLIEPIDPNELVASVRSLLRMVKAEKELRDANATLAANIASRTRELAEVTGTLAVERQNAARAEEALWHSQKLESLGRLTGGIAHDFNNLLTVVLGNLEIVENQLKRSQANEKLLRNLSSSRRAADDCANIVRQLLVFARRDGLRSEAIDINQSIAELEDFIRRSVGEQVTVEIALSPVAGVSQIDPAHLEAALLNLSINARDAMPEGGTLHIATALVTVRDGRAAGIPGIPLPDDIVAGDYVLIAVEDTGVGMSADVIDHAFEPFFTTKDVGKGSGLGLSQVFGFVKQSKGYVVLASTVGKGTKFGLYLPRVVDQAGQDKAAGGTSEEPERGSGTILVVEDNDLVLDYVVAMARELGYRVLPASSGSEALDVVQRGEKINLLFTDVVMPNGMSGIDLAKKVRILCPEVKVLITSGYSGDILSDNGGGEFMSIVKPYSTSELAKRLREAMAD